MTGGDRDELYALLSRFERASEDDVTIDRVRTVGNNGVEIQMVDQFGDFKSFLVIVQ